MKVDSQVRVDNLNADLLDGQDSGAFAPSTHNHDAAYVNETDHTKAAHDTLDIDADTLDGMDSSRLVGASTNTYKNQITITGAANSFRSGTASCNSGDKVLSGGFYGLEQSSYIQASYPSGEGWYIQYLSGSTADDLTVYAFCADV